MGGALRPWTGADKHHVCGHAYCDEEGSLQQSGIPTSPARFAGSSYGQHSEGSLGATWPRLGRGALNELPLDLPLAGDAPRLSIPPASDDSLGPPLGVRSWSSPPLRAPTPTCFRAAIPLVH